VAGRTKRKIGGQKFPGAELQNRRPEKIGDFTKEQSDGPLAEVLMGSRSAPRALKWKGAKNRSKRK